jgi:hypothetical protein
MGQQLRRAVGKIKEVERSSPSRVSIDRRSLPTEELSAVKSSPSTAAVDGVSDKGRRTSEDNVLEERDPKYDTMLNQMVGRIKAKPGGKAEMGEVCSVVSLSFVYLLFDLMH